MAKEKIKLGLVGYPLGHSFSPAFFHDLFVREEVEGSYDLFPLESIDKLPEFLESHPDLTGFNVTIPYKESIIPYLDKLDKSAEEIGAVNVVKIVPTGRKVKGRYFKLVGYNTDWLGFLNSLSPLLGIGERALVLGCGGAAMGVMYALTLNHTPFSIVSRDPSRIDAPHIAVLSYKDLDERVMKDHSVLINCTPLGMSPNIDSAPDIPWHLVDEGYLCYDLVYNPTMTTFMKRGAERGAAVKNGLEMLHRQALAAWEIWTDPDR